MSLDKAAQLQEWAKVNTEVRQGLVAVLTKRGYDSVADLYDDNPELFDELYEALEVMVVELPHTKGYGE